MNSDDNKRNIENDNMSKSFSSFFFFFEENKTTTEIRIIKSFAVRKKSSTLIDFISTNDGKLNESKANFTIDNYHYTILIYVYVLHVLHTYNKWNGKLKYPEKKKKKKNRRTEERAEDGLRGCDRIVFKKVDDDYLLLHTD